MQAELGTDQQRQPGGLGLQMSSHHTCERAFVGDGECGIGLGFGALDKLFRMRSPTQEREIADAVKLGIGGDHDRPPTVLCLWSRRVLGSAGRARFEGFWILYIHTVSD